MKKHGFGAWPSPPALIFKMRLGTTVTVGNIYIDKDRDRERTTLKAGIQVGGEKSTTKNA